MEATVRATCPQCKTALRIPAQWVGQAVKCKKCGAMVRTKGKAEDDTPGNQGTAPHSAATTPPPAAPAPAAPQPNAFDFSQPSGDDDGFFGLPEPLPAPAPVPVPAAPQLDANGYPIPAAPMPYPYPAPPGAPAAAYPMPPGYPYAPSAGLPVSHAARLWPATGLSHATRLPCTGAWCGGTGGSVSIPGTGVPAASATRLCASPGLRSAARLRLPTARGPCPQHSTGARGAGSSATDQARHCSNEARQRAACFAQREGHANGSRGPGEGIGEGCARAAEQRVQDGPGGQRGYRHAFHQNREVSAAQQQEQVHLDRHLPVHDRRVGRSRHLRREGSQREVWQ